MSVKILGGVARGFSLATPRTDATKPTSVLVRRKLFDWRQNLTGHIFIDLCAGSGAMGLEALSRGADQILLNDPHKSAFITLKQNKENFLRSFRMEEELVKVTNLDAVKWLERELPYQLKDTENTILFFDPPYDDHALYQKVLTKLSEIKYAGELWLEADRLIGPKGDLLTGAFHSIIKEVSQGDHFVLVGKLV